MGIPSPDIAALTVSAGFTSVILDCEHGFPVDGSIRSVLSAVHDAGGQCLLRFTSATAHQAAYFADIGVDGFVLSGPRSVGEIEHLSRSVRFAPDGVRSVNPFVSAAGKPGDIATLRCSSKELQVWAMAENSHFVTSLDDDRTSTGNESSPWSGVIIGPYDLASDLGCEPNPNDPVLNSGVRSYVAAAQRRGLQWGLFVRDQSTLRVWQGLGIDPEFVIIGYDRDVWFQECHRRALDVRGES
jgi:2-keto-3-deoxy-L-rhamnonate aldolase RhmA